MIGRLKDMMRGMDGEWVVSFATHDNPVTMFYRLKDHDVSIEIKKATKQRSKDANAFMWSLCTQIAEAIRSTKEEVYRKAIRDVGRYFPVPVRDDLVEEWQKSWSRNGIGWFAEVTDKSKNKGYTLMFSYCGSSTYTTEEMSRLIDYLIDDMKQMGLPIPATKEQEEALKAWESR